MTSPNYMAKLSKLSNSLHKQGLDLHKVCLIMRFKIKLKTSLQIAGVNYQVYSTISKLNGLILLLYEGLDLDCESSIDIKFNDFGDFGIQQRDASRLKILISLWKMNSWSVLKMTLTLTHVWCMTTLLFESRGDPTPHV